MARSKVIYEEKSQLLAKFSHPRARDYLNYDARIRIKDSGKTPIEMSLTFDGIRPLAAPMPPEEHTFRAASVMELQSKALRWFRKHGYELM